TKPARELDGPIYALCSGDDDGEFRSGNHGGNADGQLGDGGHGGREHRSGGSHRKPERDTDNGRRSGYNGGGQATHGGGGDAAAELHSFPTRGSSGLTKPARELDGPIYALCSGDDDGEFRSGNHGGNADGQLGDGGHGGREHRSGGSHRK